MTDGAEPLVPSLQGLCLIVASCSDDVAYISINDLSRETRHLHVLILVEELPHHPGDVLQR